MDTSFAEIVAQRTTQVLQTRELSIGWLADKLGVSEVALSSELQGKRAIALNRVIATARILGVTVSYLSGGQMTDEEPAVGVAEVALHLDLTPHTVRVYAQKGRIPGFKLGNKWRFYLSEVRAHFTASTEPWEEQSSLSRARRRTR